MSYSTTSEPYVENMLILNSWNQKRAVLREQSEPCRVEIPLFLIKWIQTLKTYEVCLTYHAELNKFDVTVKFVLHIKEI